MLQHEVLRCTNTDNYQQFKGMDNIT